MHLSYLPLSCNVVVFTDDSVVLVIKSIIVRVVLGGVVEVVTDSVNGEIMKMIKRL